MADRRPVVVVPARFSARASALRSRAEVAARALVEAVWAAGGEPVVVHPVGEPGAADARARFGFADAVLLPGGGDLSAHWYGQEAHPSAYDVSEEQDAFDLSLARFALDDGLPLLAVCRGVHVVNVALGGSLVQDMDRAHRHRVDAVCVSDGYLRSLVGSSPTVSCYHHQRVDRLGQGLVVAAGARDGTVEAVRMPGRRGWFLGVQWHPEDTAGSDPAQRAVFAGFVAAAVSRGPSRCLPPGA